MINAAALSVRRKAAAFPLHAQFIAALARALTMFRPSLFPGCQA